MRRFGTETALPITAHKTGVTSGFSAFAILVVLSTEQFIASTGLTMSPLELRLAESLAQPA